MVDVGRSKVKTEKDQVEKSYFIFEAIPVPYFFSVRAKAGKSIRLKKGSRRDKLLANWAADSDQN